jgi:lysophospholipase L1-like esterase
MYWRTWASGRLAAWLDAFTVPLCSRCHHGMHKAMGIFLWELTHNQQWLARICQFVVKHKDEIILTALIAALIIHTWNTTDKEKLKHDIRDYYTRYNGACPLLSEESGYRQAS